MAPGLAIMLDDKLYKRFRELAYDMSEAAGFTPEHLLGKPYACFAVVTRAITWKLDPMAVAGSTYMTPGGKIGYEGKLIHAIIENSGRIEGTITYEYFGDWDKVRGKHVMGKSAKGHPIPVQGWKPEDEEGLGIFIRAQVKKEAEPRELRFLLKSCYPRNSTLWATRPDQQICYTGARAFGNLCVPTLIMGVPFDTDEGAVGTMIDVSPRPKRGDFVSKGSQSDFAGGAKKEPAPSRAEDVEDIDGETGEITPAPAAKDEDAITEPPAAAMASAEAEIQQPIEEEFSPAAAYTQGGEARFANQAKSVPKIYRNAAAQSCYYAWLEGYKAADEEIRNEATRAK
jgi:hypothetical protein